ncbi:MAG: TonB family protein, partial [Bacteroidota bacterium]
PRPSEGFPAYLSKLSAELRYPYGSICIEGRVYISFVVEKNGSLSHFEIAKSLHPKLDTEAIRVIREGPKWIPGTNKRKACRVRMVLPIRWKL